MINTLINNIVARHRRKTWMGRLLDKEDTSVSLSSVIIIIILIVAIILLAVPAFSLGIEAWYNHTTSSDINGWAAYIGAVSTMFIGVCGFKWGINHTDRKFPMQDPYDDGPIPQGPGRFGNGTEEEQIINESEE